MDVLIELVKGQFQLIGFIIYIIYNEVKRWRYISAKDLSEREELIKYKAKMEEGSYYKAKAKAYDEIERFVFNQLKMYKSFLLIKREASHEMVKLGIDGILLTGLTKVKRSLMIHIVDNGYHDLSNSELEEYIEYISEEFIDSMINVIDKHKDVEDITDLIVKHEIIDIIRKIIDTSIGIHDRFLHKYEDNLK